MVEGTLDRTGGYEAMKRLLSCNPRPTAVIVDNPPCGAGAMRALIDAGVESSSARASTCPTIREYTPLPSSLPSSPPLIERIDAQSTLCT